MEAPLILLLVVVVLLLLVGPILGTIAYFGLKRLESEQQRQTPQDLTARIYALEQRLARLEKTGVAAAVTSAAEPVPAAPAIPPAVPAPLQQAPPISPASPQQPPPPRSASPTPPQPLSGFAPPPLHTSLPKDSDSGDLETVIAGRWFNRIGIVALLIAVSYFLKLA